MKGVIVRCLEKLIREKFGGHKWNQILTKAGFPSYYVFLSSQDVDDSAVIKILESTCTELNISIEQAADAFGEYWTNVFAPKLYADFYAGVTTSKEFILKLKKIHDTVVQNIKGAEPPQFDFEWKDKKTLIMTYKSKRGLMVIFMGLLKGIGKYFNEKLEIKKLEGNKVSITFPQ